MRNVRIILVVALLSGLLAGCAVDLDSDMNPETGMEPGKPSTIQQQDTPEPANTTKEVTRFKAIQTQEGTREITYIVYSTQTFTLTRPPTKSVNEIDVFKRELYATNGGCEIPCLYGFLPGNKIDDVIDVFFDYNIIRDYSRAELPDVFSVYIHPPDEINLFEQEERWYILIHTTDGIIDSVEMNASYLKQFNEDGLEWLLKDLGNPEDIELRVIYLTYSPPMYEIHLYYPQKGFHIRWRELVDSIEFAGKDYQAVICPKNYAANYSDFLFANRYSLPRINTWIPGNDPIKQLDARLTNENSDADLDHFYETYFDTDKTICFTYYGIDE